MQRQADQLEIIIYQNKIAHSNEYKFDQFQHDHRKSILTTKLVR